ncbi:MAG: hypothetical protein WKF66_07395 [Pedobacter sp.]
MELNKVKAERLKLGSPFKGFGFFLLLIFFTQAIYAQTWDESFNQKKTQIKYLGEQLAALKLYAGYMKKGYEIVGNGVHTVKDIKNGEFTLHQRFFNSLENINPAIRNSNKIADIISSQLAINKSFKLIKGNNNLSDSNLEYITRVKNQVQEECNRDLEELLLVITSGKIEMEDDERIKRLEKIYNSMLDKSAFAQSFCNEVFLLIRQKENEQRSINVIRDYYEKD